MGMLIKFKLGESVEQADKLYKSMPIVEYGYQSDSREAIGWNSLQIISAIVIKAT